MSHVVSEPRPRLTLVTGAPGSGKTTLATAISRSLQVPFIARDDVRRGLYFTNGAWTAAPGDVPSRDESVEAFLDIVDAVAAAGVSLVAEYVIDRSRVAEFERLRAVADCRVIITAADDALERFEVRHRDDPLINRQPVLDALGYPTAADHTADALVRMGDVTAAMRTSFDVPTLRVRTDAGYSPALEEILDFVTRPA